MRKKIGERLSVRIVEGGGTGCDHHFGPGEWAPGYLTVSNGWADRIACRTGEVIACVAPGTVRHFATWIAGPPDDVVEELRKAGRDELADTIESEAPGFKQTPVARLADILGIAPELVAAALTAVRLELREVRKRAPKKAKAPSKVRRPQKPTRPRRPYRTPIHQGL